VLDEVVRKTQVPVLSAATATASEVLALLGQEPAVPGAGAALSTRIS
jgi:maleate cis-trans isomerase